MRLSSALHSFILLLSAVLLVAAQVQAGEDSQVPLQAQQGAGGIHPDGKPKLLKPKTGIMKEEHDVDPGNQRARADELIMENAEDYQPEEERVIDSLEDLSTEELLAMLNAAYRHDEL